MSKKKPVSPVTISLRSLSDAAIEKLFRDMRREFESTPIGVRELARKYGLKSHTPVIRRVQDEDWVKQPALMAAHIATEDIIDELHEQTVQNQPAAAPPAGPPGGPQPVGAVAVIAGKTEETAKPNRSAPGHRYGPEALADQHDAVRAGRRMAEVQKAELMRELRFADQAVQLSVTMLGMLNAALTCEDPADGAQLLTRFKMISAKDESFAGLMKAAISGLKESTAMRRRILQMEKALPVTGDGAALPETVKKLLPEMSVEALRELRRAGEIMQKQIENQRPAEVSDVIEGLAEAAIEAEPWSGPVA